MNWKTIEGIAENTDKQWYLNKGEIARILGCDRDLAAQFVKTHSLPTYKIGTADKYFLPEVLEAVEKTRWAGSKDKRLNNGKSSPPCHRDAS